MSKYVRTTDGIVDSNQTVRRSKVVKYGETIEELCDQFVYTDVIDGVRYGKPFDSFVLKGNEKSKIVGYLRTVRMGVNEATQMVVDWTIEKGVYGAIWTDKGLIYVAKMNEKGEFELL